MQGLEPLISEQGETTLLSLAHSLGREPKRREPPLSYAARGNRLYTSHIGPKEA
jgi:hypothetical protein